MHFCLRSSMNKITILTELRKLIMLLRQVLPHSLFMHKQEWSTSLCLVLPITKSLPHLSVIKLTLLIFSRSPLNINVEDLFMLIEKKNLNQINSFCYYYFDIYISFSKIWCSWTDNWERGLMHILIFWFSLIPV